MSLTIDAMVRANLPLLRRLRDQDFDSLGALAEGLARDKSNLSKTVQKLRVEGLVNPDALGLTAAGAEALAALEAESGAAAPPERLPASNAFIPLDLIDRDPALNPRKTFNEADLQALADSIADKGVVQPILIRPAEGAPGRFRLVAGERRFRASQLAGLDVIPAVVRDLTDSQALEIALIENIQRVDLSPIEEARAFRAIIEAKQKADPRLSQRAAADAIVEATRKSLRYIEQRLQLLKLPPEAQDRMDLPADNPRHLSITDARHAMQAHDKLDVEAAEVKLTPAEILILAEIAVLVARNGKMKGGQTHNVGGAVRNVEPLIKRLTRQGVLYQFKNYQSGFDQAQITDKGLRVVRLRVPKIDNDRTLALREYALEVLGQAAFDAWAERGETFTTAWLNEPHDLHPDEIALRKRQAEQQAAREAGDRRRDAEQKKRAAEYGREGRAFLAAVRQLEADLQGLDHPSFVVVFKAFLAAHETNGPFELLPWQNDDVGAMHDSAGVPWAGFGPAAEARRRVTAIALNYASGFAAFSGPPIPGGLEEGQPEPAEIIDRPAFEALIAAKLVEDEPGLTAEAAAFQAARALDEYLHGNSIAYGDSEAAWSADEAEEIATDWADGIDVLAYAQLEEA